MMSHQQKDLALQVEQTDWMTQVVTAPRSFCLPRLHSKSLRSLNNRASQDYSRGVNSRSRNSLKRGSGTAQILADLPVKNGVSSAVVRAFLDKQVGFSGNNLHPELRKLCLVVRAMLEKPELLLIYEEVLDFGHGLEKNLQLLFQLLED